MISACILLIYSVSLIASSPITLGPVIQMPVLLERQLESESDTQMPQGNQRKMDVEGEISVDVFCGCAVLSISPMLDSTYRRLWYEKL